MRQTATITAIGLALLSVPFPLAAQPSVGHARAGTLTRIETAGLLHEAASLRQLAVAAPAVPRQRGARLLHPKNSVSANSAGISRALAATQSSLAPLAAPLLMDSEHSKTILSNFDGVSSLDSGVTNFGAEFEPPAVIETIDEDGAPAPAPGRAPISAARRSAPRSTICLHDKPALRPAGHRSSSAASTTSSDLGISC